MIIFPKFYYSGNRFIDSDRAFIAKHLDRLSDHNRKIASEEYEEIYKRNFNSKKYREARKEANSFLLNFSNEHGISAREINEIRDKVGGNKDRAQFLIERAKAAQQAAKPRIIK